MYLSPKASNKRKAEDVTPSSDNVSQPPSPTRNDESADAEQDAQVLSHAAKRKQRKSISKEELTESPSKATGCDTSTAKGQNSIWVGNLAFRTTRGNLREFFKDAGEVTRVRMPMQRKEGKSQNRG